MIEEGHKLVRLEGDQQRQIAIQSKRKTEDVLEEVLKELQLAPEFAERLFYSLPFATYEKGEESGVQIVQDLSIKAAMMIARCWGNCASAARIIEETTDSIIVEGVFLDWEKNHRVLRTHVVKKFYKPKGEKGGVLKPLNSDRLEKAVAAGMSKAIRNAILNGIPEAIKIRLLTASKEMASLEYDPKTKKMVKAPLAKRMQTLMENLQKQGITRDEIPKLSGLVKVIDGNLMTGEEGYLELLGTYNALKERFITKEFLLNPVPEKDNAPRQERPAVSLRDVM